MTKDTMIGVDLTKSVFQLHGASMTGEVRFKKKLSREGFLKFLTGQTQDLETIAQNAGDRSR